MNLSAAGLDFIKEHEGFRPRMYFDSAGLATIGYGHLIKQGENDLLTATLSQEQAATILQQDTQQAQTVVNSQVHAELTQPQFDALVSLVFNIGSGNFAGSTVKGRINGKYAASDIKEAWSRWNKITVNGQLVFSQGLANRRNDEIELYFSGVYTSLKKKS